MVDTLQEEQPGTLLEELTVLEVMDTPLEAMDTLLEAMDTHRVVTPREEQQGTLQVVLTLLEATDTPLEAMDTPLEGMDIRQEDTLQEGQQGTPLEVMDTLLAVMDIQLEGMDTRQVAILQDILLEEGIQDLLEVDIMDTTEKNKIPLMMVRGLLYVSNLTLTIGIIILSSLWKLDLVLGASEYDFKSHILKHPALNRLSAF